MADGPGSLALYQSEESGRGYALSLIILRLKRSPLLHRWRAATDVTAAGFSPRPPQQRAPERITLYFANKPVCICTNHFRVYHISFGLVPLAPPPHGAITAPGTALGSHGEAEGFLWHQSCDVVQ